MLESPLSLPQYCRVVTEGRCMEHKARAFLETLALTLLYFVVLIPASVLIIAGYLVVRLCNRSEGALRTVCKYLGLCTFTLGALIALCAVVDNVA
jgi:hypothetical protein